jgi:hypothetical protein
MASNSVKRWPVSYSLSAACQVSLTENPKGLDGFVAFILAHKKTRAKPGFYFT